MSVAADTTSTPMNFIIFVSCAVNIADVIINEVQIVNAANFFINISPLFVNRLTIINQVINIRQNTTFFLLFLHLPTIQIVLY